MDCEKVREIIPSYVKHTVAEDELTAIEYHLSICHDCRAFLGMHMDKPQASKPPAVEETPPVAKPVEIPKPEPLYVIDSNDESPKRVNPEPAGPVQKPQPAPKPFYLKSASQADHFDYIILGIAFIVLAIFLVLFFKK